MKYSFGCSNGTQRKHNLPAVTKKYTQDVDLILGSVTYTSHLDLHFLSKEKLKTN